MAITNGYPVFRIWTKGLKNRGGSRRRDWCPVAAKILGRVEELLWELADQLEPENGMLWKDLIAACIRHVTFASLRMT